MCPKIPPSWKELDIKVVYHSITQQCPDILDYLPDPYGKNNTLPDNSFFWTLLYSLYHDTTVNYINAV